MKTKITSLEKDNILNNYDYIYITPFFLINDNNNLKVIYKDTNGIDYLIEKEPEILCFIIKKLGLCKNNDIYINNCCCYKGVIKNNV